LHQSTINGEAPDAADTSDSDAATSDTDDEATTSEPEFKLVLEDVVHPTRSLLLPQHLYYLMETDQTRRWRMSQTTLLYKVGR
jgi:hypothetical protein